MTQQSNQNAWFAGPVVHGDGRGRAIGFPTANINITHSLSPGVYACWVAMPDGQVYKGAMHIGPRPTFNDEKNTVEIHILGWNNSDFYDEVLSFTIVEKLRNIEKFDTVEALVEAIRQDCEMVEMKLTTPPTQDT